MRQATLAMTNDSFHDDTPLEPADEHRLLGSLASGDRRAAEALARRSYRPVFASLLKLSGDADLAADLTQETFRRAWSALAQFDGRARFATWLYRIAFNVFISHRRRPMRLAPLPEEMGESEPAEPAAGAEARLEARQAAQNLRRAVRSLPEPLQLAVTARFWAEISVVEIARLEGVSVTAIRKRLRRAETLLRSALTQEDAK